MSHYVLKESDVISFLNIYAHVDMIVNKGILNLDIVGPLDVYSPILTILNCTICDLATFG